MSINAGYSILSNNTLKYAAKNASKKKTTSSRKVTSKSSSGNNSTSKGKTGKTSTTGSTAVKRDTTTFKNTSSTKGLETVVSVYPANQRENARKYYSFFHSSFPQVAKSTGIPVNDMASGLAALIGGAYMAYNNQSLNDNYMKPLTDQIRESLLETGVMAGMSDSEKEAIYDQMVILGMMMALAQIENSRNPNSKTQAELREVGKQFLEKLFNVNAGRIRINSSGLVIS